VVPQPGRERLDGAGGVVVAAVEAAVHGPLDPAAQRLEQCRHHQCGRGHDQAGRAPPGADRLAEDQHAERVGAAQDDRDQPIHQGPVDQPVDVPQPVAQDADAEPAQQQHRPQELGVRPPGPRLGEQAEGDAQDRAVGEPLDLLALHGPGVVEPEHQADHADRAQDQRAQEREPEHLAHQGRHLALLGDQGRAPQRPVADGQDHGGDDGGHGPGHGHRPPAA